MDTNKNTISFWADVAQNEIDAFYFEEKRKWAAIGQRYYRIDHDILHRERTVIGEGGRVEKAQNLADNRLPHPFLHELVDQKIQYLLGKPYTVQGDEVLREQIDRYCDHVFVNMLQTIVRDAICCGMGWLHVYINEQGELKFARCQPMQMIPVWSDEEHTQLDAMIRCYQIEQMMGRSKKYIKKVEVWTHQGVYYFERHGGRLIVDQSKPMRPHIYRKDAQTIQPMNWKYLPFIPIRYNEGAQPLIRSIKHLIDDYDRVVSDESNALQDQPNSILVVRNYDGQALGEFRRNLSTYRAVKVSDDGGVSALNTPIDAEATSKHLDRLRQDIYAFGRGVDIRHEWIGRAVSGVALKQSYASLDLDCNGLEMQIQAALERLIWFIKSYSEAKGEAVDWSQSVEFVFNRDIVIYEEAAIAMCKESQGVISQETIVANHPWIRNVTTELQRINHEQENLEGVSHDQ